MTIPVREANEVIQLRQRCGIGDVLHCVCLGFHGGEPKSVDQIPKNLQGMESQEALLRLESDSQIAKNAEDFGDDSDELRK